MQPSELPERFEILGCLGRGGMGEVYEAFDRERAELVALKTLRELSPSGIYRLKQEFRTLANLQHPNLVMLHELLTAGEAWFFTMELVRGCDFLRHVRPEPTPTPADATVAEALQTRTGVITPTEMTIETVRSMPPSSGAVRSDARTTPGITDEPRLREALRQLVGAVAHLHQAGYLHRDIKPSNILVDEHGRIALCDFGLAMDLARPEAGSRSIEGTVPYMSPEQAAGLRLTEASDWYSVGVVLYQALTGRLPHPGTARDALLLKQSVPAPPVAEWQPDAPEDLARLADELLAIEPGDRPGAQEIALRLGHTEAALTGSTLSSVRELFVGRQRELQQLLDAYRRVRAGTAVTAFVHGISGIGKSAVVARLLDIVRGEDDALVLSGRCYENEDVPYKAFDGVIDALSSYLASRSDDEIAPLLPDAVGELCRLFPVLRRVPLLARAEPRLDVRDPQELRARALGALRALLSRLAVQQPLVLCIDDLHWGDLDSGRLMRALLAPPDAPPLLLVATYRREEQDRSPLLRDLLAAGRAARFGEVRDIGVEPLAAIEAETLARSLLRAWGERADLDAIVGEAGGSPFFVAELARYAATGADPTRVTVDGIVAARLARLPEEARRLLAHVAVAGQPLPLRVVLDAAGLGGAARTEIAILRVDHLARTLGLGDEDAIEVYHDRIREAVVARLGDAERRATNERLAWSVTRATPDESELLMRLWRDAGNPTKASLHAEDAAERAAATLAFDRAAELYRAALAMHARSPEDARALQTRLAEALANAGRGAEAATAFLAAAPGATTADALELRRRAAEQWLYSGHPDQGVEAIASVLETVGLRIARSPRRAIASFLWGRALTAVRGTGFRRRDPSQVSAEELRRVDVLWSAATGLSMIDHAHSANFQARHLRAALATGEPYRVARGLAMEAALIASAGAHTEKRTARLLDRALAIAEEIDHPHAIGFAHQAAGACALLHGHWRASAALCARAEEVFRERCTGVAWELSTAEIFALGAHIPLGELRFLIRRVPEVLREAETRGNLYAINGIGVQIGTVASLALDDPGGALARVTTVRAQRSPGAFHTQDFYELGARAQIALYRGDGAGALATLDNAWPDLVGSLLLRVEWARVEMLRFRALALLAAHAESGDAALLRRARRIAGTLQRENPPWARAHGSNTVAAVLARTGSTRAARAAFREAAEMFDASDMPLQAAAARLRAAQLGGPEDEPTVDAELDRIAGAGARRPEHYAGILAAQVI